MKKKIDETPKRSNNDKIHLQIYNEWMIYLR